jgi:hypothetical protein
VTRGKKQRVNNQGRVGKGNGALILVGKGLSAGIVGRYGNRLCLAWGRDVGTVVEIGVKIYPEFSRP